MNQPQQPFVTDKEGIVRFQANAIVQYITEHGGFDPGHLDLLGFSLEDRLQYAQLLGRTKEEYFALLGSSL